MNKKFIGEDWDFSFKIMNDDDSLQDLNGYTISSVIETEDGEELDRQSVTIGVTGDEYLVVIPKEETKNYSEGCIAIEYQFETPDGNSVIVEKECFECLNSLHHN